MLRCLYKPLAYFQDEYEKKKSFPRLLLPVSSSTVRHKMNYQAVTNIISPPKLKKNLKT